MPFFLSHFAPMVPMSIRQTGLASRPSSWRISRYLLERGLDGGVIDWTLVQLGAERGVTAVVGPVGVDHLDLGDRGLAAAPR